uniref:Uncharacterized protein n=2 Tax=Pyramimonas obovata TaxID=1411642 RepID=A0A7S0QW16_9CHLO|mmetsp:Transcript_1741/g.3523  ORF Transcript_1741/g.3523 Transcript_1741/m.3523 type:complete len:576 (+) Transcript_1741:226-1953(+)|eukprot:CAMPEP_0118934564 /NCGR_PEP_ID=MMETSP1169-20130426/13893_1 /TAXON_ID=36882 /ORGANISM="Pyramimonas obovata, Strain CCMP722" /LENGTH=575 /DNA_ID=CAMNT_0006877483 /DNA_START=203 /DNA_END=1930 /DNA_ORIENTATION=-
MSGEEKVTDDLLLDSDDDFEYEEVPVDSESDDDDMSEDLESALRSLATAKGKQIVDVVGQEEAEEAGPAPGAVTKRPEVVDDFVRNFLLKMNMTRTLESFETEWYELAQTGQLHEEDVGAVPDIYLRNHELDSMTKALRAELEHVKSIAGRATATWDKFRKERDFHRMHHKRVGQEKNKLLTDIQRLRKHFGHYEPTLKELRHKYEVAMKEKMMMRLERDRLSAKLEAYESQMRTTELPADTQPLPKTKKLQKKKGDSQLPPNDRENPLQNLQFPVAEVQTFTLQKTFKGHLMSVSNVAIHPKKPIIATASDDCTWKMWGLPGGDIIMSGDGHKDWVASVNFHPLGTHLVSASGDCTVKLWSFEKAKCVATFTEHTQAVWDAAFHDTGDFVVSCSLDHSARLWDVNSQRCRQTFRGHMDSVNAVVWQPYTNNICTGSSDKTISIWDARSGLCTQTFYGHFNSCNHVTFNLRGDTIASTDSDGVVKLWDVRMVAELMTINVGPHPANKAAFDRSGEILAIASDDSEVKVWNLIDGEQICELKGHTDSVHAVTFDPYGKFVVTASSDNTFRLYGTLA